MLALVYSSIGKPLQASRRASSILATTSELETMDPRLLTELAKEKGLDQAAIDQAIDELRHQ